MSMFYCAECDNLADADDGCEEDASGLRLICVDCAAEREDTPEPIGKLARSDAPDGRSGPGMPSIPLPNPSHGRER